MLELPNFDHIATYTVLFDSCDKILLVTSLTEIMTPLTEINSKHLFLRRLRIDNFTDIIKIANMFIKATFKDSKNVERIRNYVLACSLYLCFLI